MEQQKSGLHGPALSERVQDGDTKSLTGAHAQECDANEGRRAEPPTSNTLKQYKFSILFSTSVRILPIMLMLKPKLQYSSVFFQYMYFASKIRL